MKTCLSATDAIRELHLQGFINDFHLTGNDLFWVQEGHVIRAGEFVIVDYYKVGELICFGINALYHDIKGILMYRCNKSKGLSPVLLKKLNELDIQVG